MRANLHHEESEDEFDEDEDGMHHNDKFHHRRNYGRGRQEEERFGKLKLPCPSLMVDLIQKIISHGN